MGVQQMESEMKTYQGLLSRHTHGDADDVLFLSTVSEPLASELCWLKGKSVTVRYWITDKEATKDEAQEGFIGELLGKADVKFGSRYSDYTGYLWTDENLKIGGHNLMRELHSNAGKWLILEIEEHQKS